MLRLDRSAICTYTSDAISFCKQQMTTASGRGKNDQSGPFSREVVIALAVLCVVLPFDLSQLTFMVAGALCYRFMISVEPSVKRKKAKSTPVLETGNEDASRSSYTPAGRGFKQREGVQKSPGAAAGAKKLLPSSSQAATSANVVVAHKEVRSTSAVPVAAQVFASSGWSDAVSELVEQLQPTPESEMEVRKLAGIVKQFLKQALPEAEVSGFASGDFRRGKAFGVAVPEVDIVIGLKPSVAARRLRGRPGAKPEPAKSNKAVLRECTELLVNAGGFKFRRSAFRGPEPKITLLAPRFTESTEQAIPVDVSVNAVVPLHNVALITEAGRIDTRAKELILLVRRWAKDRGVSHAAKGHLSPYQWSLLAIYFLQVGVKNDGHLLPRLEDFQLPAEIMSKVRQSGTASTSAPQRAAPVSCSLSTAELFKGFFVFYATQFDWRNEAVSIRSARRAPPSTQLELHVILREDNSRADVAPTIEDPFEPSRNLSTGMHAISLARLHEELARAERLVSADDQEPSLEKLLELWVPEAADAQEDAATSAEASALQDEN